jgi:hypothetical protein
MLLAVLLVTTSCPTDSVILVDRSFSLSFISSNAGNIQAIAKSSFSKQLDQTDLVFIYGVKGHQSGCLTVGSSNVADKIMSYKASTFAKDGITKLGGGGESESFVIPEPSIYNNDGLPAGTVINTNNGIFMVRMGGGNKTVLNLEFDQAVTLNPVQGVLTEIDEIVVRTGLNNEYYNGASVLLQPHFVVNDDAGSTTYSMMQNNLTINKSNTGLENFEYIFFLPASKIGAGFTYYVGGEHTVANPVLGDEMVPIEGMPNNSEFANPPSEWTKNPEWINDQVGNTGLFNMIDKITGVNSSQRYESSEWILLAEYFQDFFIKYYKSFSTMFCVNNGLGSSGNSSFQVIALDDSNAPITISQDEIIQVEFVPNGATYSLSAEGVLDISGETPLNFKATVVSIAP